MNKSYLLDKINPFLNITEKLLNRLSKENEYPLTTNYLIENGFRSYDILNAIELLLSSKLTLEELEHALGILLRSGLYDFINFEYVSNKAITGNKFDVDKFDKEVRNYMNNHYNKIPEEYELDNSLKDMDRFKDFKTKKEFKPLGILKEGKDFAIQKKLNFLTNAIYNWEWYSKYEHHGVFTNPMYNKTNENKLRIRDSIQLICCNIYFTLLTLTDFKPELIKVEELTDLEKLSLEI